MKVLRQRSSAPGPIVPGGATNSMAYTYDAIGQLKTAKGTDTNSVRRLQEQLGYAYDAAGNLNYRTNNALVQTFAVNNLNQLTNVARGGTLTVAGTTTGPATNVTVNTSNAARYADFTFAATNFVVTNSYSAIAKDTNGRISTHTISVNLPASVTNQYDANKAATAVPEAPSGTKRRAAAWRKSGDTCRSSRRRCRLVD